MIWDPRISQQGSRSDIVSHIVAEVHALCGDQLTASEEHIEEVARAVERALADQGVSGYIDAAYLAQLATRALVSIGEGRAARRLFFFTSGLVQPSEWEVSGSDEMWVLDLRQMTLRDDAVLELVFFRSLNIVLESIADIWDGAKGGGTLGLRHVCTTATLLSGGGATRRRLKSLQTEIVDSTLRKMEQLAAHRRWGQVPRVMNLDL